MAKSKGMSIFALIVRSVFRVFVGLAMILFLLYAAKTAYRVGFSVFTSGAAASAPGEDVVVTITEDMSDQAVGKLLKDKGLISDTLVYRIQAKIYEYEPLPGTYLVNTSQTLSEMMSIMMTPAADDAGADPSADGGGQE